MKKYLKSFLKTFSLLILGAPITSLYWLLSFGKMGLTIENLAGTMLLGFALGLIPCMFTAAILTYGKALLEAK